MDNMSKGGLQTDSWRKWYISYFEQTSIIFPTFFFPLVTSKILTISMTHTHLNTQPITTTICSGI